jgi:hypothetical protein
MTFRDWSRAFVWIVPLLIFSSDCHAATECDTFETRNAVLQTISDDHNNALGKSATKSYVARSESKNTAEQLTNLENEKQRPLYQLGEKIVTSSVSEDKRTVSCSGSISVTVGDTKALKEVNFTVQQMSDGKISVSVAPFQFEVP